jgi:ubiquinone/menaquinone biosynthesis C-methylase UbiE
MNYGYAKDGFFPDLFPEDEIERYPIHLYHHTVTQTNVTNKVVLEVGSGRGGGASYISRYLNPRSVTGIDISKEAILLCNTLYREDGLCFKEGDSEDMPFDECVFDIVLNVESSHCYGDIDVFLSEVKRVLKPGGFFLWCDFRTIEKMEELKKQFFNSGLIKINDRDITSNIITALDHLTVFRKENIKRYVPRVLQKVFESYAGVRGGRVHNAFIADEIIYMSAVFQKPV